MTTPPLAAYRQTVPAQTFTIDDGDPGTAQTVSFMYNLIYQGSKDPDVNAQAIGIVNAANPRQFDFSGQRRAIFNWFGRNIRFVRDPVGVETLRTAPETLRRGAGDCDCQTILMGALLTTIGNHVRITTVESQPGNPEFSHVFLEVLDGNHWVPVDSARPGARYARGPEYYRRRFAWPNPYDPTDGMGAFRMAGLNGYGLGQTAKELNASYKPMQMTRLAGLRGLGRLASTRARMSRLGRLGRMGQDDVDWSGIATAITAGTTGASNIIRAESALPAITTAQQLQLQQQAAAAIAPAGYINLFGTLIPTNTILMGAAAFALLLIWEKR
jgi:hypothetical protein